MNNKNSQWTFLGDENLLANAGNTGWIQKIPHATEKLRPWASTNEPADYNYWSPCTQNLHVSTRKVTTGRSLLTETREPAQSNEDPGSQKYSNFFKKT